ncbi:hypothetical protein N0V83_004359 [Neocucurbitaria cava]|uniref:Quinate repressor protein n=1 Tax=Neocucurbitaria cava TaxID=798079 RepID=A0A9W9CMF1_9PLEO|nr:hypothetical protein N0V83_004359 [Neocucurbitaria cava]
MLQPQRPRPSLEPRTRRAASASPTAPASYKPSVASPIRHDPNASIVLVGIRGTGLSTLAVIAASALHFRVFDAGQHFAHVTGVSRARYKATHGVAQYRREEMKLLRSLLLDNPYRAVIVCGPGAVEATGQALVTDYAQSHPVIYVSRDVQSIQQHLRLRDAGNISSLARLCTPTLRALSMWEFHNLSDVAGPSPYDAHQPGMNSPKSLALKQVEHDFLHLIRAITARPGRHEEREAHLRPSAVPVEDRLFTYALLIPLSIPDSLLAQVRPIDITADAIELVIPFAELCPTSSDFTHSAADYISRQYYTIRRYIRCPVIFHVQVDQKVGVDDEAYFNALYHGLHLAPEFLCVNLGCNEDMIRRLVSSKGTTKIIAQDMDTSAAPSGWNVQDFRHTVRLAERLGADMVRQCREATTIADNFAVRHIVDQAIASGEHKIPIIAYNTGHLGRMSRYLNSILSPVYEPLLEAEPAGLAPASLLTIRQTQSALYSSLLLDPMFFGIYGNNVSKSLSPAMHNAAFQFSGMPHEYRILQHSTIQGLGQLLHDPNCGGLSVTAPFKSEVIPLVDFMSREAKAIGAINTLIPLRSTSMRSLLDRNRAGPTVTLYGENTDWIGIHSCVHRNLSPINAVKNCTTGLVVGAGGMARAATYALIRLGVPTIFVHNRTRTSAENLIHQFQQHSLIRDGGEARHVTSPSPLNSREGSPYISGNHPNIRILENKADAWPDNVDYPTIVVSCVATRDVNGQSSVDTSLPSSWLASPTGGVVIELSYTPLETPLLKQIRHLDDQGWIAVDGLQVLPEQAKLQFELFTSRPAPIKLMRREVLKAYKERCDQETETLQRVFEPIGE